MFLRPTYCIEAFKSKEDRWDRPFFMESFIYKEIIGDFGIVKYFFDFLFDIQKGPW